jgi:Fe-S-cluster containining protein
LKFSCISGCTICCRQPGWVYLTEDDLLNAAKHLGMTPAGFEAKYVVRTKNTLRFRRPCPFVLETGCGLHPNKPEQCRTFPYWPEILEDPNEASYCPGIELTQIR